MCAGCKKIEDVLIERLSGRQNRLLSIVDEVFREEMNSMLLAKQSRIVIMIFVGLLLSACSRYEDMRGNNYGNLF